MKRIGVLTSGGDTPGMNAAIRAVLKIGIHYGYAVMGIYHGYNGLIDGRIHQLQHQDVDNMVHQGGTLLRTARCEAFRHEEGIQKALKVIHAYGLEGIVCIGGDGSARGARDLHERGVPTMVLPGTIDNDMGYTDYTIGFDTAINSVMNEIYKIRDTMRSHDRVGVIEVMGRQAGDIALYAGLAGGTDIIFVPENKRDWGNAAEQLTANKLKGKLTSIVVMAEGAGGADEFKNFIRDNTDIDIKSIVLGYIQRGGQPTAFDRVLATRLGARAVELLNEGISGRAIGISENKIIDLDIVEALNIPPRFDNSLYELNDILAKF